MFEQPGCKLFTPARNLLSHSKGTEVKIFEKKIERKIINYTLGYAINIRIGNITIIILRMST
jgi:hypothetical protein